LLGRDPGSNRGSIVVTAKEGFGLRAELLGEGGRVDATMFSEELQSESGNDRQVVRARVTDVHG
jgi:hypothetical protein